MAIQQKMELNRIFEVSIKQKQGINSKKKRQKIYDQFTEINKWIYKKFKYREF